MPFTSSPHCNIQPRLEPKLDPLVPLLTHLEEYPKQSVVLNELDDCDSEPTLELQLSPLPSFNPKEHSDPFGQDPSQVVGKEGLTPKQHWAYFLVFSNEFIVSLHLLDNHEANIPCLLGSKFPTKYHMCIRILCFVRRSTSTPLTTFPHIQYTSTTILKVGYIYRPPPERDKSLDDLVQPHCKPFSPDSVTHLLQHFESAFPYHLVGLHDEIQHMFHLRNTRYILTANKHHRPQHFKIGECELVLC